ncbi:MAG TPA: prepilin-type N-terminal cleavage/methylation domain-containing protein [Verrucomicrobiae bacterium]|nr:prepilin-type N-terminal cleavage/methylation domain-containing protein [Verrucomicrobiae bacterium]
MTAAPTAHPRRHGVRAGWTLTELLVAMAILAGLAALLTPATDLLSARVRQIQCLQNLRNIGSAMQLYAQDHDGTMPNMAAARLSREDEAPALDTVLADYVKDPRVFRCPADNAKRLWESTGTSYHWNSAVNGQKIQNLQFLGGGDTSRIPLVGDKEGFHEGCPQKVNILYADGRSSNQLSFR